MALTAEQIRASLEARKKQLLNLPPSQAVKADGEPVPLMPDGVQNTQNGEESRLEGKGGENHGRSTESKSTGPEPKSKSEQSESQPKSEVGPEIDQKRLGARGQSPAPQAPEIELAVLSALYQYPATCFPIFNERAKPDFFFSPTNRSFLYLLSDYFNEHGQADPASFLQSLLDSGQLDKHGGAAFLSSLLSSTSPPSALEYHLDILRDKFVAREAFRLSQALAQKMQGCSDVELYDVIAEHERSISDLSSSLAARNGHLSFRRVSEIFGMTFDETDNFFGDRVIAAGQPCTLLGPGDIGKSRLSLQLAISMITGRDFLGMPTHAPNKIWLFIQSENSCRRLYNDLKNMESGLGLSENERAQVEDHLLIHTLENDYDSFLSLEDDKIYAKVSDLIQKVKPDLISWDPLNSLTDEDLNADVDMRKVCMKISHVTKQGDINRVPFVVHHALTGKTGAAKAVGWEKSSYGRNSKVLHAWTRAQINLAPRSPDDSTLLIMSCGKNNNGKAFPETGVLFDVDKGVYSIDPHFDRDEFREQVGIVAVKRSFTPQMILDLRWPSELLEKKPLVKTIVDELGCGRSRGYELVEEALKRGLIKYSAITRLYSKR